MCDFFVDIRHQRVKQLTEKLTPSFLKEINPMQQEIQYLKNKVKNLFEENMKLRSQIEGILQEMKPGNNHTPTTYSETNEIKKSLEKLTKIHQEHSETSNKDIINIENDIRNIDKELAKQANKISEQMKSIEKTDSSVKEMW